MKCDKCGNPVRFTIPIKQDPPAMSNQLWCFVCVTREGMADILGVTSSAVDATLKTAIAKK